MGKKSLFFLVFVLCAGFIFGTLTSATLVQAAPDKPVDLTFAIADSPNHPDIKQGFKVWADEVEKRTGGKVKITIHAGQTLAKASEQYDMVLRGAADITKVVATHYRGRFPLLEDKKNSPRTGRKRHDGQSVGYSRATLLHLLG